jgi:prepilin-type N-terminal cleavage/methylation domain-containing protein
LRHTRAFTIVELLVVMAIILILAGLVLATSSYVHTKGARSRAEAEIAAMSAALENYKADNGIYPVDNSVDARVMGDPKQTVYKNASLTLYKALSGDNNLDRQPDVGVTTYMLLKPNQLSPADQTVPVAFLKDPFGNSYGYSTIYQTDPAKGYNPTFDLWTTSNLTTNPPPTNDTITPQWIKNW